MKNLLLSAAPAATLAAGKSHQLSRWSFSRERREYCARSFVYGSERPDFQTSTYKERTMKRTILAAALAFAATGAAIAGPAADEAKLHFQAIGSGDTAVLARGLCRQRATPLDRRPAGRHLHRRGKHRRRMGEVHQGARPAESQRRQAGGIRESEGSDRHGQCAVRRHSTDAKSIASPLTTFRFACSLSALEGSRVNAVTACPCSRAWLTR